MPESLEEIDPLEETHWTGGVSAGDVGGEGVGGEDVGGGGIGDVGIEGLKQTLVDFRIGVRYPGSLGRGWSIFSFFNFSRGFRG